MYKNEEIQNLILALGLGVKVLLFHAPSPLSSLSHPCSLFFICLRPLLFVMFALSLSYFFAPPLSFLSPRLLSFFTMIFTFFCPLSSTLYPHSLSLPSLSPLSSPSNLSSFFALYISFPFFCRLSLLFLCPVTPCFVLFLCHLSLPPLFCACHSSVSFLSITLSLSAFFALSLLTLSSFFVFSPLCPVSPYSLLFLCPLFSFSLPLSLMLSSFFSLSHLAL